MLRTEEEAKKIICPVAQAGQLAGVYCVGAGCMAWRGVQDVQGKKGYCGMASAPPQIVEAMLLPMVRRITSGEVEAAAGVILPS